MTMWGWALRRLAMPAVDRATGQWIHQRLTFLERAQWWDARQIADYQQERLRQLVHLAYREVPFYRERMDRSGIAPGDIRAIEDLQKLPIATKADLTAGYPATVTYDTGHRTYEAVTSGSTGRNFRVREDAETAGQYRAAFLLSLLWAGWKFGDASVQTGMSLNRGVMKRVKDILFRTEYVSAADLHDEALDRTLATMERKRIRHLMGYPGSLRQLALRAERRGWNTKLSSIVSWGDMLTADTRAAAERAFGCAVHDTYGCGEGIQIAAQCERLASYHLHELDTIVECVDDEGRPLPAGQQGNVLLTRLHPGPMPFIRYAVGDMASLGDRACACGRSLRRLEQICGRIPDLIVTPSGNRLIVHFFTGILEHYKAVDAFQVVQDAPDSLLLRIVPCAPFGPAVAESIVGDMRRYGLTDMRVRVEPTTEIPLSPAGKWKFIVKQ